LDVIQSVYSAGETSNTELKITLVSSPYNLTGPSSWHFYNIWVDTSNEHTSPVYTWNDTVYEYIAHFDCRYSTDHWINTSYLKANRYYLTGDGSAKVEGTFWWNSQTDTWESSDPNLDIATVVNNTISFDIDGAIYREQPLGNGIVVQAVANAGFFGDVRDIGPDSGWVDEFDNMCNLPTGTPTNPFPAPGFIASFLFLAFIVVGLTIRKRK
jgi:hypothetical protein